MRILKKLFNWFNLKEIVSKNYFLYCLAICYRRIFWKSTKSIIEQRKNISLFDYKSLSKPISNYPFFYILENNYYGHGRVLSRAFDVDDQSRIEHGSFLGNYIPKHNYFSITKRIITFSKYRKDANYPTRKQITCVGPYIKYAQSLLNIEQTRILKDQLGKVLLVFPSHSIDAVHAKFDINDFINFILIKKKKYRFDTVVICLYWKDIELGLDKYYLENEFKIVTAGHTYDYYFLDRLKTIIDISDFTISNDIGTHLGYCVTMNKPHFIYVSNIRYEADIHNFDSIRELEIIKDFQKETLQIQKKQIIDNFSQWSVEVTSEQKACVEYYWGNINTYDGKK